MGFLFTHFSMWHYRDTCAACYTAWPHPGHMSKDVNISEAPVVSDNILEKKCKF